MFIYICIYTCIHLICIYMYIYTHNKTSDKRKHVYFSSTGRTRRAECCSIVTVRRTSRQRTPYQRLQPRVAQLWTLNLSNLVGGEYAPGRSFCVIDVWVWARKMFAYNARVDMCGITTCANWHAHRNNCSVGGLTKSFSIKPSTTSANAMTRRVVSHGHFSSSTVTAPLTTHTSTFSAWPPHRNMCARLAHKWVIRICAYYITTAIQVEGLAILRLLATQILCHTSNPKQQTGGAPVCVSSPSIQIPWVDLLFITAAPNEPRPESSNCPAPAPP